VTESCQCLCAFFQDCVASFDATTSFVKFNVGTTHVFASTSEDEPALKALGWTQG
jgi:hypothetical protein